MSPSLALVLGLLAVADPQATVSFSPAEPRFGDLAIVYIKNGDPAIDHLPIRLFGYEFVAFRVTSDQLRAIVAVPIDVDAGPHPLEILYPPPGRTERVSMKVAAREWDHSELKVSNEFTQKKSAALLARLREEERQFHALFEKEPGPPRFNGKLGMPVPYEVTAVFGTQRIFNGKLGSTHYGLDLEGKTGDPIKAAAAGKVVLSAMRWASGGTVIIDHGGGLFTAYFHMSRRKAVVGQAVKQGELLGWVGKTGRVTGPHLHLAVLVRARKVEGGHARSARSFFCDPAPFLELEFAGEPNFLEAPPAPVPKGKSQIGLADDGRKPR